MQQIKLFKRLRYKLCNVLSVVIIMSIFFIVLHPSFWSKSSVRQFGDCVTYEETNWILEDVESGIKTPIKNKSFINLTKGKLYKVSTNLTYDGNNDSIPYCFLHTAHIYCRVLLDGQEVFRYMKEDVHKKDKARSPGFIHKDFPLPSDCKGKLLEIELLPVLNGNIKYIVNDVFFGDYKSVIHNMIHHDLPHNIITLLFMLLGIVALIFSAISLKGEDFREGVIIGIFALVLSLYSITENITNRYLIANPYYLYFLNYFTFSLIPLTFACLLKQCMEGEHKEIFNTAIVVLSVFLVIELFLHFSGLVDMREMLVLIHVVDFSSIILFTSLLLSGKNKKKRISLELQLLPFTIGAFIDAIVYWAHLDLGVNDATFSILGILFFLVKELVSKLILQSKRITNMQQHTIEGIATLIESRDGSTGSHVRNTGVYASMLAQEMFLRKMYPQDITIDFVEMIGLIAPLHDVGKIKISDTILNKPGKFTAEEYEIMKTHAELGGEIIGDILRDDLNPKLLKMAQNIATYHHERWDGTGYPKGLKGEEIPIAARIMSVADVFDALSSERVYKEKMNIDEVLFEMRQSEGKQFQKEIVEVFISLRNDIEKYLNQSQIQ